MKGRGDDAAGKLAAAGCLLLVAIPLGIGSLALLVLGIQVMFGG